MGGVAGPGRSQLPEPGNTSQFVLCPLTSPFPEDVAGWGKLLPGDLGAKPQGQSQLTKTTLPPSMVTTPLSNMHSDMLPPSLFPWPSQSQWVSWAHYPPRPLLGLPVTKNPREHSGNPKDTRATAPHWGPPQPWHPTQGLPRDEAPTTYGALATARLSGKRLTNSPADPGKGPGPVSSCPPPAQMLLWPLIGLVIVPPPDSTGDAEGRRHLAQARILKPD